jgi:hypothetical protein
MAYARILLSRFTERLAKQGFVGTAKNKNEFERYHLPGGDNYAEWLICAPNLDETYVGPHFDYPNVIAHVRTTFRSTTNHGKVLLLEEIQSDWNQTLRDIELGKVDDDEVDIVPPDNPYRNNWLEVALRAMLLLGAKYQAEGVAWLPGRIHAKRFPWANADGLGVFYDDIVRKAVAKLGGRWNIKLQTTRIFPLENNLAIFETSDGVFSIYQRSPYKVLISKIDTRESAENIIAELEEQTEEVPILFIGKSARADLNSFGLPMLGAIGKCQENIPTDLVSI